MSRLNTQINSSNQNKTYLSSRSVNKTATGGPKTFGSKYMKEEKLAATGKYGASFTVPSHKDTRRVFEDIYNF